MPVAFVQYEVWLMMLTSCCLDRMLIFPQSQEIATKAIDEGRGLLIEGRKCRTEVARAAREYLWCIFSRVVLIIPLHRLSYGLQERWH